jgi:hypothetical protein
MQKYFSYIFILFLLVSISFGQNKFENIDQNGKVTDSKSSATEVRVNLNAPNAVIFSEDFDSYVNGDLDIGDWEMYDGDGATIGGISGFTFPHSGEAIAWTVVDWTPSATINAHSGTNTVATMYNSTAAPNNDWLVSPPIVLDAGLTNANLSFWTYILSSVYIPELLDVYISTDPNAVAPGDFTTLLQAYSISTAVTWEERVIALDSYIGDTVKIALKYYSTDLFTVLVDDFSVYEISGPGLPLNPNPADGVIGVPITASEATWDNPAGATSNEFWFGTDPGSLALLQSGGLATSFTIPPGTLEYNTYYYWRVDEIDAGGTTTGPVWSFRTERDPSIFFEDFESGTGSWTITNNGGTCDWAVFSPPYPNTYLIGEGALLSCDTDNCGVGASANSTITLNTGLDFSMYSTVILEFDSDFRGYSTSADSCFADVSVDGGVTWTNVLTYGNVSSTRITEHVNLSVPSAVLASDVRVRFTSVQPGWDYFWAIDNITMYGLDPIPVELTSFAAVTDNRNVTLNWSTATELNNSGFQVERSSGSEYQVVGFVAGSGTTTEVRNYLYVDQNVNAGTYTYRLKQVDFDGTFEYSNAIEVEVLGVKEFALGQNYPNPFNPSTTINFSLAVDSKVSLKIFDVLGQEVATLINGQLAAGSQEVSFNASSINSGVYFYRIDASGIDGQKFSSVKKMILTK